MPNETAQGQATQRDTIRLIHLGIGYRGKGAVRTVASDITATIRQGELTCLLGANGVGKSTLLRTLSAFQPRVAGDILLLGQSLDSYDDKQLSRLIGVVLTEKTDVRNMSVRELVSLGRSPYTGFWGTLNREDWQVVDEAIASVGIESLSQRMVHTLSDGERQKVMIAKALAQQTPVILLDEPTAFLDFPSKVEMMQTLRRLAREQQKTIFLSTHDLELALQVADRLWLMEAAQPGDRASSSPDSIGQLSIGSPKELASQGALSRFVERPGITFDRETLAVKVNSEK